MLVLSLAACGGSSNTSASSGETTVSADESANATEAAESDVAAVSEPTADIKASVDSVLGNWIEVDTPDRFANITQAGNDYSYEDPEGTYEATFADGVLKVKVTDTDTADVYFDAASGNLIITYQDSLVKLKKK